jgi:hypothetical protein
VIDEFFFKPYEPAEPAAAVAAQAPAVPGAPKRSGDRQPAKVAALLGGGKPR